MKVVDGIEEMTAEDLLFRMKLYNMRCPVCEDNCVEEFISWHPTKFMTKVFTYFCSKCGFLAKKKITEIKYGEYTYDYELLRLKYE